MLAFTNFILGAKSKPTAPEIPWSPAPTISTACGNLDRMFSQDKLILHDVDNPVKPVEHQIEMLRTDNVQVRYASGTDIYFRYLLSRRDYASGTQISVSKNKKYVPVRQESSIIENILRQDELSCMSIRTSQKNRFHFLGCLVNIALYRNFVVLVRSVSLTEQIIFLASSWVKSGFGQHCQKQFEGSHIVASPNHLPICEYYHSIYKINPSMHLDLSKLKKAKAKSCVLVSLSILNYGSIHNCVEAFLKPINMGWKSTYSSNMSLEKF